MSANDQQAGSASIERQPHALLDMASRRLKGLKIERLLDLHAMQQPIRLLEVGTGSGAIAHYFGTHPSLRCEVDAVDVHDNRLVREGYRYQAVHDTKLPFEDAAFDVVISNHVIEHVGDEHAQKAHLAELRRVLRPGGVGYLAVPNRWMLVEPHYRLAFLSWWPRSWRSPYLRVAGRGKVYDCEPLQMGQLQSYLASTGLDGSNICIEALRATYEIEKPHSLAGRIIRRIPDGVFRPLRRIIPTLIYRLRRSTDNSKAL